MTKLPYVFIHPMLGSDDAWAAFLAELPNGTRNPELLSQLANSPQFDEFDQRLPWFFPAESNCGSLQNKGERAVIVFSADISPDNHEALTALESQLRQASRKLALAASSSIKLPASGTWDYLLIDASHARSLPPYNLLGMASRTVIGITGLHTQNDREWTLANASSFSTGEYLLARSAMPGKADMTKLKLLKLLSLIEGDASTSDLEDIFREESKLSYSLLRLVNSAAMSPRSPITSFGQAINLLGRRQLQRWLQLLVYSDPNNGQHPTPLLPKAAARGRLIELLCSRLPLDPALEHPEDMAFMIGTFSLLDVLLNMPMSEILNQLPLPELAQQALGELEGPFGKLLSAVCAVEKRELTVASEKLDALGISPEIYLDTQLTAISWAAKIRPAN
ncbi:EAL and HDOD domain-containing protein [Dechloromonas sp. ARDL1]|uniref:EAL and HDOD domain-containing protein n=1 Tax=Dechloromonas sp. ARDL1 TaxID=3322121 RepID=UPI003DA72B1A